MSEGDVSKEVIGDIFELLEAGDAVSIHHIREIICYTCDLMRYLDRDFDTPVMMGIFSAAMRVAEKDNRIWERYMENNSDEVNGSIIQKENPEGRMDS